jgi:hypothetical protein
MLFPISNCRLPNVFLNLGAVLQIGNRQLAIGNDFIRIAKQSMDSHVMRGGQAGSLRVTQQAQG